MEHFDVWLNVAKYVPPNPLTYTRLAQVNRTFYQVFMSDTVWQPLNIYDIKEGITKHFSREERRNISSLEATLSELEDGCVCAEYHVRASYHWCRDCGNRYYQNHTFHCPSEFKKGCVRCYCVNLNRQSRSRYSALLLILNNPESFKPDLLARLPANRHILVNVCGLLRFANDQERNDRGVVLRAVQFDGLQLQCAPDELRNDETIVVAAMLNNLKASNYAHSKCLEKLYMLEMYLARADGGALTPMLDLLLI